MELVGKLAGKSSEILLTTLTAAFASFIVNKMKEQIQLDKDKKILLYLYKEEGGRD